MNCFKVHRLFEHESYSLKIYPASSNYYIVWQVDMCMKVCASTRIYVFQPLAFGNNRYFFLPSNRHLIDKSCKITLDLAPKILTFKNQIFGWNISSGWLWAGYGWYGMVWLNTFYQFVSIYYIGTWICVATCTLFTKWHQKPDKELLAELNISDSISMPCSLWTKRLSEHNCYRNIAIQRFGWQKEQRCD